MSILVTGDAGCIDSDKKINAAWHWHKGNPDGFAG